MEQPTLFLHVDVDNVSILENEYGIPAGVGLDQIFTQALPDFLELLQEQGVHCTLFAVGQDLVRDSAREFYRSALAKGHRLANHSYTHAVSFGSLDDEEKVREIVRTHDLLRELTGAAPVGFRGPGYYADTVVLRVLQEHDYAYDSTLLPGPATLLMKMLYLGKKTPARKKTFGMPSDLIASRKPRSIPGLGGGKNSLVQFPIAVAPYIRTPIHTTFAYKFGLKYLDWALDALAKERGPHVYLFHAIDMLNYPDDGGLKNCVAPFAWSYEKRKAFIRRFLARTKELFTICTTEAYLGR